MSEAAIIQELASCLNVMTPDEDRVTAWVNALGCEDFKFGFGVLRSADDEFDAFGVLAAISSATWTWDDHEGAWAADGQALLPTVAQIASWLDIDMRHARWIERFRNAIAEASDAAGCFSTIIYILQTAQSKAKASQRRLDPDMWFRAQLKPFELSESRIRDRYADLPWPLYGGR